MILQVSTAWQQPAQPCQLPKEAFGHKAVRCEFLAGTAKHDRRYYGNPLFVPRCFFLIFLCYTVLYRLKIREVFFKDGIKFEKQKEGCWSFGIWMMLIIG